MSVFHKERARQLLDFDGLDFQPQKPTDVDLSIDFDGWVFVVGEVKYADTPVKTGQRWHLEKIVRSHHRAGHYALAIILRHEIEDTSVEVRVADCEVTEYYAAIPGRPEPDRNSWVVKGPQKGRLTCRSIIDQFIEQVGFRVKNVLDKAKVS